VDEAALTPGAAERLQRAAQAAQELSDSLWQALRDELADPSAERVAELAERLAAVAGAVSTLVRAEAASAAAAPAARASASDLLQPRAEAAGRRRAQPAVLIDELEADGDVEAYSARARWRAPARAEELP
jgi:hypothetical protein